MEEKGERSPGRYLFSVLAFLCPIALLIIVRNNQRNADYGLTKRAKNRDIFPNSIFYGKPLMLNFIKISLLPTILRGHYVKHNYALLKVFIAPP
jgi:hypothetical protein